MSLREPAAPADAHAGLVSENPANFTPNVLDGGAVTQTAVYAFQQVGSEMFVGGEFEQVADAGSTVPAHARTHAMAFDAGTGAMKPFAPVLDGPVWAIQHDATTDALYLAGEFRFVNGTRRRAVVKMDPATGELDPAFNARLTSGKATDMRLVGGRLYLGGTFAQRLVALDPATGDDTGHVTLAIAGTVAANAGATDVYRFAVSPDGSRLVAIGNFTSVDGQDRSRAFMADLSTSPVTLTPWYYQPLENMCRASRIPQYLRGVDFSPDGNFFCLCSTGFIPLPGGQGRDVCDATARFETDVADPFRPTWINYTGGDTLHSVCITGPVVYVQGHMRFLDNGATPREGIGAMDPETGQTLDWNPGKTRAVGGRVMYANDQGLWVGSDGARFAGERRDNLAFCPL